MNTNIQSYSLTKVYTNGKRILLNENAAKYNGRSLSMIENRNGKVKFAKLSNEDMLNVLLKHQEPTPLLQRLKHDFPTIKHHHRRATKSRKTKSRKTKSKNKNHTHRRHKTKLFKNQRTRTRTGTRTRTRTRKR